MNKRAAGSGYEMLAMQYLEAQGYQILERNFRSSSVHVGGTWASEWLVQVSA